MLSIQGRCHCHNINGLEGCTGDEVTFEISGYDAHGRLVPVVNDNYTASIAQGKHMYLDKAPDSGALSRASAVGMDAPANGLFGDPQLFVIENTR